MTELLLDYQRLYRLDGKIALVTGGAGLLGRRFCAGLAGLGARVAVLDVDGARAAETALALSDVPGRHLGIGCDVSDPVSVHTAVSAVESTLGPVDVLVNNAATKGDDIRAFFDPVEDYRPDVWRQVMGVNLDGMFFMAQRVGRAMLERKMGGSIIQTSSIYGLVGPDARIYEGSFYLGGQINTPPVYAASKAGVVGLSRFLATTWGPHGIRVNCLVPGGVESGQNEEFRSRYSGRTPLGRMAQADEIVGAVLFLASDMSSYVTGQVLAVDGGWTAW